MSQYNEILCTYRNKLALQYNFMCLKSEIVYTKCYVFGYLLVLLKAKFVIQ